eukprot:3452914-Pyramimonas_sp.AAC.1
MTSFKVAGIQHSWLAAEATGAVRLAPLWTPRTAARHNACSVLVVAGAARVAPPWTSARPVSLRSPRPGE